MGVKISYEIGDKVDYLEGALTDFRKERIVERIWKQDYTVWKPSPQEIANRLGWLNAPSWTFNHLGEIEAFAESIRRDGFQRVLLLGMGGSTLAPEVISRVFSSGRDYLPLNVLDTTDPALVLKESHQLERFKTLIVVSSKSGTTAETDALMKYFYRLLVALRGHQEAGRQMVVITDPNSRLAETGKKFGFRRVFLNDPNIGGRFSALSFVGMVPAALIGVNCRDLLEAGKSFVAEERERGPDAISAQLGVFLGDCACRGKDKLFVFVSPQLPGFGAWLEQLIAESTGKEGKGILPVLEDPSYPVEFFGLDSVFVHIRKADEPRWPMAQPSVDMVFTDLSDLAHLFFLWEFATAVIGWRLKVNPFDQPDVEAAKKAAREALSSPIEEKPDFAIDGIEFYGLNDGEPLTAAIDSMVIGGGASYIALQVYLTPTPGVLEALKAIRTGLIKRYGKAVTVGFGPRYLHSTGQLHKGDAGRGFFIQFTEAVEEDVPIPDDMEGGAASNTFGTLWAAQAYGDRRALERAGRKVIRLHFSRRTEEGLTTISRLL